MSGDVNEFVEVMNEFVANLVGATLNGFSWLSERAGATPYALA